MVGGQTAVVTGATGFSGSFITRRLLDAGVRVRTLTGHPGRPNSFGSQLDVLPFRFDDPAAMAESMRGADVFYNTFWIRFSYRRETFDRAVEQSRALISAAQQAGVRRIVHVSITNPSEQSPLPYFRGKAIVERAIRESSLSHAILRPAVLFGEHGILINNIAWLLRRFPVFAIPGSGDYRLQPIFVDDLAALAIRHGARDEDVTVRAIGPEAFTFNELVELIREMVGSRSRIVHVPPRVGLLLARGIGFAVRDVTLTADEVAGLTAGLLYTESPPAGETRLSDWLRERAALVGQAYLSELALHYR